MGMFGMLTENEQIRRDKAAEEKAARDAFLLSTLSTKKDWNPEAQIGFWDKVAPWDTANERADSLNRQAMSLIPGSDTQLANEYYDAEGQSNAARWMGNNWNTRPSTQEEKQESLNTAGENLGKIGQGASDLFTKYFAQPSFAGEVPQQQAPQQLAPQQSQKPDLPSSLAKPDNIGSFWDYLRNKQ